MAASASAFAASTVDRCNMIILSSLPLVPAGEFSTRLNPVSTGFGRFVLTVLKDDERVSGGGEVDCTTGDIASSS